MVLLAQAVLMNPEVPEVPVVLQIQDLLPVLMGPEHLFGQVRQVYLDYLVVHHYLVRRLVPAGLGVLTVQVYLLNP